MSKCSDLPISTISNCIPINRGCEQVEENCIIRKRGSKTFNVFTQAPKSPIVSIAFHAELLGFVVNDLVFAAACTDSATYALLYITRIADGSGI